MTVEELERLHLSIGINHAMIEDPSLFLPLGIHPLWIPRLVAAILAVHLLSLWHWIAVSCKLEAVSCKLKAVSSKR